MLGTGADRTLAGGRFVAPAESGTHPRHVEALIVASPEDTALGSTFVYGWDAPGRALRPALEAAVAFAGDVVGEELSLDGTRVPLDRLEEAVDSTAATGAIETIE